MGHRGRSCLPPHSQRAQLEMQTPLHPVPPARAQGSVVNGRAGSLVSKHFPATPRRFTSVHAGSAQAGLGAGRPFPSSGPWLTLRPLCKHSPRTRNATCSEDFRVGSSEMPNWPAPGARSVRCRPDRPEGGAGVSHHRLTGKGVSLPRCLRRTRTLWFSPFCQHSLHPGHSAGWWPSASRLVTLGRSVLYAERDGDPACPHWAGQGRRGPAWGV